MDYAKHEHEHEHEHERNDAHPPAPGGKDLDVAVLLHVLVLASDYINLLDNVARICP